MGDNFEKMEKETGREDVIGFDALYRSMWKCKRGVSWKDSVAAFTLRGVEKTEHLSRDLHAGTYKAAPPKHFRITHPKPRSIASVAFRDRVYQRSLNDNAVYPEMVRGFIFDNYACQKGKGTDPARERLKEFMRAYFRHFGPSGWVAQFDIRGYYPNMSHEVAEGVFARRLDAWSLEAVKRILREQYPTERGYDPGSQLVQIAGISVLDGMDHYIKEKLSVLLKENEGAQVFITQGFICRNAYGEVDNLQRGGSDYTASLIGAAINAEEIQIWTDIDGMHNNDPRVVEKTEPIHQLHFEEAAELAYFGAKILHPTCVQPAKYAGIPVRLLNTMDPNAEGTTISNATEYGKIKAVAAKDNITAIKIKSSRMLLATGFLRKVFEIFESYQTSIDMVCTSEVGVSMSIDNTRYLGEIVHDLKKYGTVGVDLDMCIICVVGDMDWENVGFESKALSAMQDIPVRMVSYGGSNYNISFLIKEEDKEAALRALSASLFAK